MPLEAYYERNSPTTPMGSVQVAGVTRHLG